MRDIKRHFWFVLQSVIVGLAMAFVYLLFTGHFNNNQSSSKTITEQPFSYAAAVQKITPSVVSIYTQSSERAENRTSLISPRNPYVTRNYVGSGVIASDQGHIVTNKHVINNAQKIYVSLWDNQLFDAEVTGIDDHTDLAVIKIAAEQLTPAQFADSDKVRTGDVVLAVGTPFGLNQSVSLGIVSATGRKGLSGTNSYNVYENFIQTDAAINEGNSGGALINPLGEVVGISTASYNKYGAEGINFAIPSNTTAQIISSIQEYGEVRRGWFGLSFYPPNSYLYGLTRPKKGVRVYKVFEGSSAADAGIQKDDIVTYVGDNEVNSFRQYQKQLLAFVVGETATIKLLRDGKTLSFELLMQSPPSM